MTTTPFTDRMRDQWMHPSYEVRVRGSARPTFLWGSAGLTENISFDKQMILHVRNEQFGEVINLGTQVATGVKKSLGALLPGECVSIPINDISGIFATCILESMASCLIANLR